MKLTAMEDLLVRELDELYDAESQILKALPKMASAAARPELRRAFEDHYKQTRTHVERLGRIYKMLDKDPEKFKCEPISEMISQGQAIMAEDSSDASVADAALITAAQKVEHYEIACYGCARTHASLLGYEKIAGLLKSTLDEEEDTDAKLTALAESKINVEAVKAPYAQARTAPRGPDVDGGVGFGGMLLGLAVGAAVALLYAPKTGEETRNELRRRGEDMRKSAEDLIDKGRQTVAEQRDKVSDALQPDNRQL